MTIYSTSAVKQRLIERFIKILDDPMGFDKALIVAAVVHYGQEDKGQNPYIRHPMRVAEAMDCDDERVVAVSHDEVEDSDGLVTMSDLPELGFTLSQIKAIDALTKRDGETYESRIERVKKSYVAVKVKIQDIKDNLQVWRLKSRKLTVKDMDRQQHYIDALHELGAWSQR